VGDVSPSYKGHRYPVEVISHCVWLCFRFPLSFREVEELMLERGVVVSALSRCWVCTCLTGRRGMVGPRSGPVFRPWWASRQRR
jgi:hypothetical protein